MMPSRESAMLAFLDEVDRLHMHGVLLTLHGKPLMEGYWQPYSADAPHRLYSVSKSVVSLAIGLLVGDGVLTLDDRICTHFPEWVSEQTEELLRRVTIRDMLRMATCYDRSMYSPLVDADWTKPFFFGKPTHPPATVFSYDTSASQTLCALVERKTGMSILPFMEKRLFSHLHMNGEKRWLKDGAGTSQGGTGLVMTLRDFSKLANFCMSDGGGLLSEAYLRAATSFQIATDERAGREERYGYGYQFWRMREGFSMYGLGGQMAMCLPEKQLCLCTTADLIMDAGNVQPLYDAFFRHLSKVDELPSDAAMAETLEKRLDALRYRPLSGKLAEKPITVSLSQSTLPFDALTLTDGELRVSIGGKPYTLPYASGEWRQGVFPTTEEPCITSGGWQTDDRFHLHCEVRGDQSCGMDLVIARNGAEATVRIVSSLWEVVAGWSGESWGTITQNA